MSVEENKAIVGRWFSEFWGSEFDPAVIDELAAPDIRFEYSLHEPCRGRDEVRAFATKFRAAFPDLELLGPGRPDRRGRLRRRPVGGRRNPDRRGVRRHADRRAAGRHRQDDALHRHHVSRSRAASSPRRSASTTGRPAAARPHRGRVAAPARQCAGRGRADGSVTALRPRSESRRLRAASPAPSG